MVEEPNRIGLTAETSAKLDELLEYINPEQGEEGIKLIKFDLYRLAIALGIKNSIKPPSLSEKSNSTLRVSELDPEQILYTVLDNSDLVPDDIAIYSFIERFAEHGIKTFYKDYQQTGELPLEKYFQ